MPKITVQKITVFALVCCSILVGIVYISPDFKDGIRQLQKRLYMGK